MDTGQTVFSQLIGFLPKNHFDRCVQRYRGNYRTKTFSCFDQYLCMAFAQITYRKPLAICYLGKGHAEVLVETGKSFCPIVASVSLNASVEVVFGKKAYQL